MSIRATADQKFNLRFLIIGLVLMGFGLYCLYDGFVAYPAELERSEHFYEKAIDSKTSEVSWKPVPSEVWAKIAAENNWSQSKPKTPDVMKVKILWQYGMAIMSFLVGLPVLFIFFRNKGAWIEADDDAIWNNRGQRLEFAEIKQVDKHRWEKKGIANLIYETNGAPSKFVVDDLKFQRKQTDDIMMLIESKVDENIVVGAPLERNLPQNNPTAQPTESNEAADEENGEA